MLDIYHEILPLLSFQKYPFQINFRNTIRVSNSVDPDQAQQNVGPDLDQNFLQRLSAGNNGGQKIKLSL